MIATGVHKGRPYVITRPDRARGGDDGPTFDEDLLGVIEAVERRGRPVPFHLTSQPPLLRAYFGLCVALTTARAWAAWHLVRALGWAQRGAGYRAMAQLWWAFARRRVSYVIRLPMRQPGDAVYHELPVSQFDLAMVWQGRPVERFTLALLLNARPEPASRLALERAGPDTWRIAESAARIRYRGLGLEAALRREADAILARGAVALEVGASSL